jgi:hypothetical protein
MEDINTQGSTTATIQKKAIQPRLILQALVFTGILHFSVGQVPSNTTGVMYQSVQTSTPLSPSIGKSVLQYASQQLGLPTSALRIVHSQPRTWSDNCLGVRNSGVACTQMPVPGWQVTVASGQHPWIYRTNTSGSVIKLEGSITSASK